MRRWLSLMRFRLRLKASIWAIRDPGIQWAALNNSGPLIAGLTAAKEQSCD